MLLVGTNTDDHVIRVNKLLFEVLSSSRLMACRFDRKVNSHNMKIPNQTGAERKQSFADDPLKGEYAGNPDIQTKVLLLTAGMPSNQAAFLIKFGRQPNKDSRCWIYLYDHVENK